MAEWITLARPYAKAAFDYALEQNALGEWSRQLNLAAAVIASDKVTQVIESPAFTTAQQAKALIDLLGADLADKPANFLRTLAANKRLPLLPEIAALFDQFKARQENAVDVEVSSAFPLGADLADRLAVALRNKLKRDVKLSTVIDRNLLGGVVVRSGDVVIDGSVRGRLEKLAKAISS
jgi:F-type H+-transporting ATPase subunit delta